MDEKEMDLRENSLICWVRSFPGFKESVQTSNDVPQLFNGILILQLAEEIILRKDPSESEVGMLDGASAREVWEIAVRLLEPQSPWLLAAEEGYEDDVLDAEVMASAAAGTTGETLLRARGMVCGVLEAMLGCAVSADCPERNTYIKRIMGMETRQQQYLMEVIEDQLFRRSSYFGEGGEEVDNDTASSTTNQTEHEEPGHPGTPKAPNKAATPGKAQTHCSPGGGRSPYWNKENGLAQLLSPPRMSLPPPPDVSSSDLKGKLDEEAIRAAVEAKWQAKFKAMEEKYKHSAQTETQLRAELAELLEKHRNLSLAGQSRFLVQEEELKANFEERVKELEQKLKESRDECQSHVLKIERLNNTIAELNDEVDVIRPAAERAEQAEATLERLRQKLEDSQDMKRLLKQEEEAHAKAIQRLLEAEREVQTIPGLKRQLETYKKTKMETELTMRDLQEELKTQKQELSALREEKDQLEVAANIYQKERQCLQKELDESTATREFEGVGMGMSELNPALTEELARLREDNEAMHQKLSNTTEERVEALEHELEDAKVLADALQLKFTTTKSKLDETLSALEDANNRIESLEKEMVHEKEQSHQTQKKLQGTILELENCLQLSQEELESRRSAFVSARSCSKLRMASFSWLTSRGSSALTAEWERLWSQSQQLLANETKKHREQREGRLAADITVQTLRVQIEEERNTQKKVVEDLKLKQEYTLQKITEESKKVLASVRAAGEEEVKRVLEQAKQEKIALKSEHVEVAKSLEEKMEAYQDKFGVSNTEHNLQLQKLNRDKAKIKTKLLALESENEDLRQIQRRLEREKAFLRSESDRFRRQASSRGGAGSSTEHHLISLQEEIDGILEENKRMKEMLENSGSKAGCSLTTPEAQAAQSNGNLEEVMNQYENKLGKMNEERRELMRGKSAALIAQQTLQKELLQKEDRIRKLSEQNTTLQLDCERLKKQQSDLEKQKQSEKAIAEIKEIKENKENVPQDPNLQDFETNKISVVVDDSIDHPQEASTTNEFHLTSDNFTPSNLIQSPTLPKTNEEPAVEECKQS